jgi:hypothetical protein
MRAASKIFLQSLPGSVSIGTIRQILDTFVRSRTPDRAYQIMAELSRCPVHAALEVHSTPRVDFKPDVHGFAFRECVDVRCREECPDSADRRECLAHCGADATTQIVCPLESTVATAPTPTDFAQIVGDDFPVPHAGILPVCSPHRNDKVI